MQINFAVMISILLISAILVLLLKDEDSVKSHATNCK